MRRGGAFVFDDGRGGRGVGIVGGDPTVERIAQGNGLALCAAGSWTARFAPALEQMVADAEKLGGSRPNIFIDVSQVSKLDAFGAWLIERLRRSLSQSGVEAKIAGLSANYSTLVDEVRRVKAAPVVETSSVSITGMLEQIGRSVVGIGATVVELIDMLGAVLAAAGHVIIRPRGFRLTSTVHHLEQVCWRAVPIIVLITFLIGCIISQQRIFHFRQFGADIFVVDMLGLLRLRDAISINHFIVGLIKAPVMAAVIGIVACVEGLAVQGSAESLGQHTTSSVVKGIFFVIVMDGVFAIFFASIGM